MRNADEAKAEKSNRHGGGELSEEWSHCNDLAGFSTSDIIKKLKDPDLMNPFSKHFITNLQ